MYRDADARFMRWAIEAILHWQPSPPPESPVFQIHGASDLLMPPGSIEADVVVPGAGHLLNLTHADTVNRFIGEVAAKVLPSMED